MGTVHTDEFIIRNNEPHFFLGYSKHPRDFDIQIFLREMRNKYSQTVMRDGYILVPQIDIASIISHVPRARRHTITITDIALTRLASL